MAREWSPIGRTVYGVELIPLSNRRGCPSHFQYCAHWIFRLLLSSLIRAIVRRECWGTDIILLHTIQVWAPLSWAVLWNCPTPFDLESQRISLDTYTAKMSKILNPILQYTNKNAYKSSFFFIYLHFFFSFRGLNKCINPHQAIKNWLIIVLP